MSKRINLGSVLLAVALFLVAWAMPTGAQQKTGISKPQDKVAMGEEQVKQLLLLMDTDKNGRISKAEYMKFMEAAFNRLDKNKSGDLDVAEVTKTRLQAKSSVGK